MKILQVLQSSEITHAGMTVKEASKIYAIYYGINYKYCKPAIFKCENNKYYSMAPQIILKELSEDEINKQIASLKKCKSNACNGHIIATLNEKNEEVLMCDVCKILYKD